MPRVPFVGRLHLYLPPFRTRANPSEFHTPEDNPNGFTFAAAPLASDTGSGSESASWQELISKKPLSERERLYYKFKAEEEERKRLLKQTKQNWFKEEANAFLSSTVPFWARNSQEYVALVVSFCVLILESVIRVITLALPTPLIKWFYEKSRTLFNELSPASHTTKSSSRKEKNIVARIREADGFVELCAIWGYEAEEHIVQTKDGYLLGLHRVRRKGVGEKRGRERSRGRGRIQADEDVGKKVVYLHHGLLMNSEVWVCLTDKERCLPFTLVESGYDVWLGNNRGNKYSKKCIHHSSSSVKFWDFSMDQFAMHDIPDSISYILETTKSKSLSYIGFSQGTAQAFATLSIHPSLNEKVDVFIALAPAMSPAGLHNSVVDAFIKASPNVLYLLFGRKSILSSATFWQSILYPPIFARLIDASLTFLFNWRGDNINLNQKIAAYSHLYSFTSTKSVVHWFQIIRNQCFQMYDDDFQGGINIYGRNFYKVAKFPTRNITTPIVLVWGGSDSLVDINVMLRELPSHTVAKGVPHYEHLDMLWANDVDKFVFPTVLEALETYSYSCEGEVGETVIARTEPTISSKNQATNASIPQLMACRGSAGFISGSRLSRSTSSPALHSYSEDEHGIFNVDSSMDEVDDRAGSSVAPPFHPHHTTRTKNNSQGSISNVDKFTEVDTQAEKLEHMNRHAVYSSAISTAEQSRAMTASVNRPTSSSSQLEPVTEEMGSNIASPGPISIGRNQANITISRTSPTPTSTQSVSIPKPPTSPPHERLQLRTEDRRLSNSAPPPASSSAGIAFKEFFTNPTLFTKKLGRRSNSVSSGSHHEAGSVSDSGGSSSKAVAGKTFGPTGITLGRAGAAVAVSTEKAVEGLDEAERRRRRRQKGEGRSE